VIARFADANEAALRELVARAMFNKGYRLGQLNRFEEEIAIFTEGFCTGGSEAIHSRTGSVPKWLI
jgi:hypothetical protein